MATLTARRLQPDSVLPVRPRFLAEAVLAPFPDGFWVDGTHERVAIRGKATTSLVPLLLPLLDGGRDLAVLADELHCVSLNQLELLISRLHAASLIEDGRDAVEPGANVDTLKFFRRVKGFAGVHATGAAAYEAIRTAEVVIADSGGANQFCAALQELLSISGIERVRSRIARAQLSQESGEARLVISVSLGPKGEESHGAVDRWCNAKGVPWLRVEIDANRGVADIGPLFHPGTSPCYRCLQVIYAPTQDPASALRDIKPLSAATTAIWTSEVGIEVVYLLSRVGTAVSRQGFRRWDMGTWTSKTLQFFRVPGCPVCRPTGNGPGFASSSPDGDTVVDSASVYEDCLRVASRNVLTPRSSQISSLVGEALGRQFKSYPVCRKYWLDQWNPKFEQGVLDPLNDSAPGSQRPLNVNELGALARLSAGLRGAESGNGTVQRWAATAGNLGSVELYAVVYEVEGLEPGVYFYAAEEHSLARVQWRKPPVEIDEFLCRLNSGKSVAGPEAYLILTGAFHRLLRKYGSFAYRLVNLDAGACMSQIHAIARCMSLSSSTVRRWDDSFIAEQLGLDTFNEHVTGVVRLNQQDIGAARSGQEDQAPDMARGLSSESKLVGAYQERTLIEITESVFHESCATAEKSDFGRFTSPSAWRASCTGLGSILLPKAFTGGTSLSKVLLERKTIRHFSSASVSIRQLGTILRHAELGDRKDWPEDYLIGNALGFCVLTSAIEEGQLGVFLYDGDSHALVPIRGALSNSETAQLFTDKSFASAPVKILITGYMAEACGARGTWGHRQLMLRAGAAAHRLYLSALSLGLAGAIVAGLAPDAIQVMLGINGYTNVAFVAAVIGHSAQQ